MPENDLSSIPGAVIGYTRRGPIRLIAGGSGEDEGGDDKQEEKEGTEQTEQEDTRSPEEIIADLTAKLEAKDAEVQKWTKHSRTNEERAKKARDAQKELDRLKREGMSDTEAAVAAAREEAAQKVREELGGRLVEAEFRAAAANRLSPEQISALLEDLNVSRYLTDDGDVDRDRISAKVDILAPVKGDEKKPAADLGQGQRKRSQGPSIDEQIKTAQDAGKWRDVIRLQREKATQLQQS